MELSRLLLIATLLAGISGHPVQEESRESPLPINPGGPMIPALPPTTTETLHSHHTSRPKHGRPKKHGPRDEGSPVNPGGPLIPAPVNPGGPFIPAPINPGGPMIPAPVNPGGPMIPAPVNPGGPMIPAPVNPGGPLSSASINPGGPMIPAPINPGGPIIPASAPTTTLRSHHVWRPKPKKSEQPVTPTPMPFNPGGPMIPAKRQEGPIVTPTPTSPTITVRPGLPSSDIEPCTSTIDITISRLSTPPYWPQCSFDGTMTAYPATVTKSQEVDCGGCLDVEVLSQPEVNCPAMIYNASTSVETPTTEWTTVCSQTTALSQMTPSPPVPTTDPVAQRDEDTCPTTLYVSAQIQGGPVETVFQGMVSVIEKVPCGGCQLVVVTAMGGEGPVIMPPTSTLTAVGTTTVYQCQ